MIDVAGPGQGKDNDPEALGLALSDVEQVVQKVQCCYSKPL